MFKEFRERHYTLNSLKRLKRKHQLAPRPNFLSEWCGSGASQKKPPKDSTKTYSLGRFTFRDVPQIAAYHKKFNVAGEGSRCNARQKKCGWAVL